MVFRGDSMLKAISHSLFVIGSVSALYTVVLYFFYVVNWIRSVEDPHDPLMHIIERSAWLTAGLYVLAGLAFLAG